MNRKSDTRMLQRLYIKLKTKYFPEMKAYILHRRFTAITVAILVVLYSWTDYRTIGRVLSKRTVLVDKIVPLKQQMVDIISVGSLLKEHFHNAQAQTFGRHDAVRNFFRITEMNDTDRECFTDLTYDELDDAMRFCTDKKIGSSFAKRFRRNLFRPKKNAGWMCAQKRPIDGLNHVLQQYKDGKMELPKYLFIIDDDTYINMEALTDMLLKDFSYERPHVVAGCSLLFLWKDAMPFPYGGFGSFLSRASIQRLLQPINCTKTWLQGQMSDSFSRLTCWRLNQNNMGEKQFYTDGMSISDLIYKYSSEQPFSKANSWPRDAGYCFHSDHAIAYFFNMYHIAVPDDELAEGVTFTDKLRRKYKYAPLYSNSLPYQEGECYNIYENCTTSNIVCHYTQPAKMFDLFRDTSEPIN